MNEPGRTDWEGFATATRAAAAGGVTTIIDMPLNCLPPTVSVAALDAKRRAADGQCHVDVGFWGGAVPGNLDALGDLHDAGVFGLKCFLVDSGVPEFPPLSAGELGTALSAVDALFLVHAEDPHEIQERPTVTSLRRLPRVSPSGRREQCRRHRYRCGAEHRCARTRAAPVVGRRRRHDRAGEARRRTNHRGNLSALPDVGRRRRIGWGDAIQVLPTDPRGVQPGHDSGGGSPPG